MKRITLILWLLLSTAICTFAYDFKFGDLYYNITSDSTAEVTYQEFWSSDNYSGLTSAVIPESVTYDGTTYSVTSIGDYAFSQCYSLTSVTIPNSVTSIGSSAFSDCSGLTSVTIPNSVTSIGSSAFGGCSGLTSITIPNSVTSIGEGAFAGCSGLTSITVENYNMVYDSRNNCNAIIETETNNLIAGCQKTTIPNSVTSIGRSAFSGCTNLTSITIPNSVTSIKDWTFAHCTSLTSVTIPNSVTSIGESAFRDCSSLTSVTIGNSVTSIEYSAFSGCTGLTSVTIPNSVTSIGSSAFRYCSGLTSVTIGNSVTSIGNSAFYYCSKLTSVTIPNSVTSIGSSTFSGCSGLTSVTIPNSVTSIGDETFRYCSSLTSVTIPNSVTSIGNSVFYRCSGLTSVTIGNSVTSIGSSAFEGCSGLTSVTIPNNVTNIEYGTFYYCSKLTSVTIPNSVTNIGYYAFSGCSGLTSVTIPNSVTNIGYYAFENCSGLTSVTCYATTPPYVQSNTFSNLNVQSIPLYVPLESMPKYNSKDVWKDFLVLPISAMPVETDEPILSPEENKVTTTWPAIEDAITYTIEISNDDTLVCSLVFDAGGALKNMRYATPARHAAQRATHAETMGYGFRFVVEGLDYATTYTYTITAKDIDDEVLSTYSGIFTTTGDNPATDTEDVHSTQSQPAVRKVFRNGQVYILRGDKTYTLTGSQL